MATQNPTGTLFEATRETYASAFDAWNQVQTRTLRLSRLWLDEVEASQKETRRTVDDLLQKSRQTQEALLDLTQDSLRNVSSFWRWPGIPTFDEFNSRLEDLSRKVDQAPKPNK